MESARLPFLLCVVHLQPLCAGRNRHASAADADSAPDRGRAKIYPRLHHRPTRLELDLSFDRESVFVARVSAVATPSASIVIPSAVEGSRERYL